MSDFSDNLNRLMAKHEKTRKEMAQDLGVPYTTLTEWVKGNRTPKMDKVQEIAEYFHCTISDLLEAHTELPETAKQIADAYMRADKQTQDAIRRLLAYSEMVRK